jgi:hypothetical protein
LRRFSAVAAAAMVAAALAAPLWGQSAEEEGLRFARFDLLDRRGGYAIPEDSVFYPGETIFVGLQVAGYAVDDDYRIRLRWQAEARGPDGVRFAPAEGGEFAVELSPKDEGWQPSVEYQAAIPNHAVSGFYTVTFKVTDELAKTAVERAIAVRVEGAEVSVADELSIRNFAFALTKGGTPLERAVYGRGDSIHASFYITGYRLGEDNRYDVECRLRVIDGQGKTVLALDPPGETGSPFYPRLWLPAEFRLDLENTIPSGDYTVLLEVRDDVGGNTLQTEERFQVR